VSGYFTGATGATVYRGDAFGSDFADNVFVGDAGGNLIHRKKLFADGASLVARRPDDEQTFEFAASKDTWCRPVNFANAPDGALYAIDMYREIIEHPDSIPPAIKKHLDLNSGNDRGRIYRIVPENFTRRAKVDLSSATTAELVATLAHPNGWHRDTAARLLYEKQDQSAVPLLEKLAADSSSPLGRMHALHALDGLWGALSEKTIVHALNDNEPVVREHAILLSEKFLHKKNVTWKLFESLEKRIADPDARVRLQLAFSLGENFRIQAFISHDTGSNMPSGLIDKMSVLRALSQIAKQDAGDPWISAAVLSTPQGVPIVASHLLAQLASDKQFVKSQYGEKFLAQVVQIIGARNNADEVANALNFVAGENTSPALVRALGDGLKRAGTSILAVDRDGKLKPVFANAAVLAADRNANPTQRADALSLLSLQDFKTSGAMLAASLHEDQSEAVQLAAIDALGRFSDAQVADELLRAWPDFKPRLRSAAFGILSARPDRALVLLGAIENGQIKAGDLSSTQSQFLVKHRDKRVSELATKLLVKPAVSRDEVIGKYQSALTIKGDTARGRKIYSERCVSCHRAEGSGFQLGPDFVTVKTTGREKLLVNILDPNREVAPQYLTYLIETKDGESLTGIIVNDAPSSVTLRQPFGKEETIPRAKIRAMSSPGTSLMPEGLEAGLTPAQFADLLDFIESLK
jgi:putative heme-binding domain-containing protein